MVDVYKLVFKRPVFYNFVLIVFNYVYFKDNRSIIMGAEGSYDVTKALTNVNLLTSYIFLLNFRT